MTLVLFVSVASAAPKQKIAILGIEAVVGANNQIDPADTRFAKELTTELRSRANNSKLFELTKDQRELVDEKLMNNCGAEHPQCMAPIGASMGADVLLFGKVANLKGGGYKVTLTLVSVGKRQIIASDPNAIIAVGDTKNPGLANWVREHYRKITGEGGEGTLIITAPGATAGRVLVEGETKDSLKSGTATITLPEGRYRVGVEADGFKLWEQEGVTISADRPTELKPTLVRAKVDDVRSDENGKVEEGTLLRREGTLSSKKGNKTLFKVVAAVGLGGAAVGGVIWGYEYFGPIKSFDGAKVSNYDYVEGSKKFTNIDEGR
ncbi:MAG TPA: carboxypeptidase-like regulatory domain-containing protein, partial [Kofleriaceae bacterium]|nr:carboxypeptidase-like regulatory domain-containing protein [Kofleriaceae bacterium]